jgi:hypothetical protein
MRALFGIGLALCVAGCGSDGPAGSCRVPASGSAAERCIEFAKGYSAGSAKELCAMSSGGVYSADMCAAANRVGHCTASSPDGDFTQVLSYYPPTTAADAMTNCASTGGTFAAD